MSSNEAGGAGLVPLAKETRLLPSERERDLLLGSPSPTELGLIVAGALPSKDPEHAEEGRMPPSPSGLQHDGAASGADMHLSSC